VVAEQGIAPVLPRTVAGLHVSAASFDSGSGSGSWQALTPHVEWQAFEWLSLFTAIPLAQVRFDGGRTANGPGDLALSLKARLVATPHGGLLLSAGLGVELPTGDGDQGLGGGHVELAPFAIVSTVLHERGGLVVLGYGLSSLRFAVDGGGHSHTHAGSAAGHSHGSVLAPHGQRELFSRAMLAVSLGGSHLSLGGEGAAPLWNDGSHQLAARAEIGQVLAEKLHLTASAAATVVGEQRYGITAGLGAAWMF
jgi:hypothetical protein